MIRKSLIALSLSTVAMAAASPAMAGGHTHYCSCGHSKGAKMCGTTTSSTSGGTTTTSTSGGTTTTSGGTTTSSGGTTTSSSGGTAVPEPGMLGMLGAGLIGLAYARRRKARA